MSGPDSLRKLRHRLLIVSMLTLAMIGAAVYIGLFTIGHEVIGFLIAGIAIVLLVFTLFKVLEPKHSKTVRYLRSTFAALLIVGAAVFTALEVQVIIGGTTSEDTEAPYLIILGAKVNGDTPSLTLRERIDAAYDYMVENPSSIAILSGGQGSGEAISEKTARIYDEQLREEIEADRVAQGKKPLKDRDDDEESKGGGMATVSTTDPDSGLFRKGEHKTELAYTAHAACDEKNFVSACEATPGNVHGSNEYEKLYNCH